jgi:hypothetical protein
LKETIVKKHFVLLSLTFSALLLAQPARANELLLRVGPSETIGHLPATVYHYPVYVSNVAWNPGCIEPYRTCRGGLFMTYMLALFDLIFYYVEDVDNTTHTITIVVDSWSYTLDHPLPPVEEQIIELPSDELELFADYAVEVLDYQYSPIWTGSIRTDRAQ